MTTSEFKNVTIKKLSLLNDTELKKVIVKLNNDFSDASSVIFNAALDLLEERLSEENFIKFCDEL